MTANSPRPGRGSGSSGRGRTSTSRRARQRARRRRRNRRIAIAAVVLLVVLLVGGGVLLTRGGGDESAQTATRPTTETTGAATDTTGAATTTPTTGTTATTDPRPGGPCKPENLGAAVVTSAVRANGSVRVVTLTNDGKRSCTLEGYPGLQLTGLEGEALTVQVVQGGGAVPAELGVQTVTVQPGSRASFVMTWGRGGSCLSVQSLSILLPGEANPVPLESLQSICGDGTVNVSPFQPDVANA